MIDEVKLLLVEDDPIQRRLMSMLLETMEEVRLTVAADGLEGLELAREQEPDVMVLDLILPELSGMELLKRYRRMGGKARVLALSKAAGEAVHAAAIAAGADFFLCKPALWPEVRRTIRALAGGLSRRCDMLLEEMGAPGHVGRHQAARCAAYLGEREDARPLLKAAYLETAREEDTSVDCVEKNIRKLIEGLAAKPSPLFARLFEGKTPTNKTFLLALSKAARAWEE